ncbi:hypothetical protein R5R35_006992 [Gryllus longicercus]|uniref:Tc1-like transposase DDE domain-containing protein n=1 Tax=Gryllus longicercus TaxID=2509291 RepID=A0AAN9ZF83_9ORTH
MIEWLRKMGIDCDHNQRKSYLFDLILANKPSEKVYIIDKMASERGHTVIRLPPYNCDLNHIELAWAKIKRVFREHNITGDLSVQHLRELAHYAFSTVTSADWKGFCEHIQKCENEYWQKDGILEIAIDDIIVNVAVDTASESERDRYSDDSE